MTPKIQIGKTSTQLPSKTAMNSLVKNPGRTIVDYSKMVPTQSTTDPQPLLVNLMRKGA